jgi:hypothetical protein
VFPVGLALFPVGPTPSLLSVTRSYTGCNQFNDRTTVLVPAWNEAAVIGTPVDCLMRLVQVDMGSRVRHIRAGRRGAQLRDAVAGDVRRAAELLETGLASLSRRPQPAGRNGPG